MVRFTKNDGSFILCGKDEDPKKVLMDILEQHTKENGGPLTFEDAADVDKNPGMVQPNSYTFYYDSFSKAAELAWSRINGES